MVIFHRKGQTAFIGSMLVLIFLGLVLFFGGVLGTMVNVTCTNAQAQGTTGLWLFISCNWGLFCAIAYILTMVVLIRYGVLA
jgi:hypothetical protein